MNTYAIVPPERRLLTGIVRLLFLLDAIIHETFVVPAEAVRSISVSRILLLRTINNVAGR